MAKSSGQKSNKVSVQTLKTLNKVLGVMSLVGWLFFIIALYMFHYASPDPDNLYDTILGNRPETQWNASYADLFVFFMSVGIVITLAALLLNIFLYRARRTHIWINLMLLIVASAGILIYFLRAFSAA